MSGNTDAENITTKPDTPDYEICRVCLTPLKDTEHELCPDCQSWQPILGVLKR